MIDPLSLLVIGWSQVGKTVLAAQLMLRLRNRLSQLRFRSPPTDVSLLESALSRLSQGLSPEHTPKDALGEIVFKLDPATDLMWPDYGGEQVRRMAVEQRKLPAGWRPMVTGASGWLLLVRPEASRDYEDTVSRPVPEVISRWRKRTDESEPTGSTSVEWSDQALIVETLQILLEAAGGLDEPPALAVVLTCWDEVPFACEQRQLSPSELLAARFPLVDAFVRANWSQERLLVAGLSAQGQRLSSTDPDDEYAAIGPENHGYLVLDTGKREPDLTKLIGALIERAMP